MLSRTIEQSLGNHGMVSEGSVRSRLGFGIGLIARVGFEPSLDALATFLFELVNVTASGGPWTAGAVRPVERRKMRARAGASAETWTIKLFVPLMCGFDALHAHERHQYLLSVGIHGLRRILGGSADHFLDGRGGL